MSKAHAQKQIFVIYSLERKIKANKRKNVLEKIWRIELVS